MKKKTLKIVGAIAAALLVAVVIVVIGAWERIVPVVIGARMESEIADVWKGPVRVEGVRMGYGGELRVREIYLGDKAGRQWVRVEGVKVGLEGWPSVSPAVRAVDANGLDVKLYFADGKLVIPAKLPEAEAEEEMEIPDIAIRDVTLTLSEADGPTVVYDNIRIDVAEQNDVAQIAVVREARVEGEEFSLKGGISTLTGDADMRLKLSHRLSEDETAILLGLARPEGGYRAAGELNVDCRFEGPIVARHNMRMEGQASITGGSVSDANGQIAGDINARADIKGQRVDVRDLSASVAGGRLTGTLFADHVLAYPIDYGGDVSAENIQVSQLSAALHSSRKTSKGAASGQFDFAGTSKGVDDLKGELAVQVRGVDVSMLPVMSLVFKTIGLGSFDPLAATNGDGRFNVADAVLTVEEARVSSTLGALKVEPGGTYNVKTGEMDMYVGAVPLSQVQEAIEMVPVADMLMKFKDRLVRVHVKGNVNEPEKLITKEPLGDIGEAAGGILKGAAETGKDVGEGVVEGIKGVLGGGEKKEKEEEE